jgi:hypothetical protein
MRPNDVAQALDLDRIAKDHVWKVEPSCATSGEGKIWRSKADIRVYPTEQQY